MGTLKPYETVVKGTEGITVGSLVYNSAKDDVLYPDKGCLYLDKFPAIKGCKEFIDGFLNIIENRSRVYPYGLPLSV